MLHDHRLAGFLAEDRCIPRPETVPLLISVVVPRVGGRVLYIFSGAATGYTCQGLHAPLRGVAEVLKASAEPLRYDAAHRWCQHLTVLALGPGRDTLTPSA